MWTREFWTYTAERALKTGLQALVSLFGVGVTVMDISWGDAGALVGTAVLLSIASSVLSSGVGAEKDSPSLVPTAPYTGRHRQS